MIETLAAAVEAPLSWRDFAECVGADPELFFPQQGQSQKPARDLCAACDVRSECLDYAVDNRIDLGVWGGLAIRERRKVWRERRQQRVA